MNLKITISRLLFLVLAMFGLSAYAQSTPSRNPPPTDAEAHVVKGNIVDAQGDPVPNATLTISGYAGTGATVVEYASSDALGNYRMPIVSGLYTVNGEVDIDFAGQTYRFDLHPADGSCEAAYSSTGIVENFVLELSGPIACMTHPDPTNYNSYSGGTVSINADAALSLSADATVAFTLTPTGPLADGSVGAVLTFVRTVENLLSYSGSVLDGTKYLYDVPLGTYELSGSATLPGGAVQSMYFSDGSSVEPATAIDVGFEARLMLPYGIRVTNVSMYDSP